MIVDLGETWSSPNYVVKDGDDQLGDPESISYVITLPDGTVTAPAPAARAGLGTFTVDYLSAAEGDHQIAVTATGGVLLAGVVRRWTDSFTVQQYRGFISLDDALRHMRTTTLIVSEPDRETLRDLIHRACSAIEDDLSRTIVRRTIVEEHERGRCLVLRGGPALSISSVNVDGVTADPAGYRLTSAGIVESRYGWQASGWPGIVTVTYVAGMPVVPPPIRDVALHVVARMWQTTQQMPHPALDDSGGGGGDFAAMAELSAIGRVDPITYAAYKSYRMPGFA